MQSISRPNIVAMAASFIFLLCGASASAAVLTYNVDGVESWDAFGDADNTVLVIDLGAALGVSGTVLVDGIGWNLGIDTVGESWLSEAAISFQTSSGSELLNLVAGIDDTMAGSGLYDSGGVVDLVSLGLNFELSDGLLRLEFFETFDDVDGVVDAIYNGDLQIRATAIPVPPALALMLGGLSALGVSFGRRRRNG